MFPFYFSFCVYFCYVRMLPRRGADFPVVCQLMRKFIGDILSRFHASLPEWSKGPHSSCGVVRRVGSTPTGCNTFRRVSSLTFAPFVLCAHWSFFVLSNSRIGPINPRSYIGQYTRLSHGASSIHIDRGRAGFDSPTRSALLPRLETNTGL